MEDGIKHLENLVAWFGLHQGALDTSVMGFRHFPSHGRGAVAQRNILEGEILFTIPRSLTLSTRTSKLPSLLGPTWKTFDLGTGWAGLILCMLWEEALGEDSKWSGYLATLPTKFDTPMFWPPSDLAELKGTAVVDKIGRDEAEKDYYSKLLPAVQAQPDVFPPHTIDIYYTLERYHIAGSRILSRSFHVEKWRGPTSSTDHGEDQDEVADGVDEQEAEADTSQASIASAGMDVDEDASLQAIAHEAEGANLVGEGDDVESDDDDAEDPSNVAMVPMADMLNARYGSENAKLFYEPNELRMVVTKDIQAGEQIWNTYGNPPNSDLLRRYGHVDVIADNGSPADIVELRADLIVVVAAKRSRPKLDAAARAERVEWWLDEGGDDTFVLETDLTLPDQLISFIRLLLLPKEEWDKTRDKGKLPKPKIDRDLIAVALEVLKERQRDYTTTLEDDERALSSATIDGLSLNMRYALIVRAGEKRILARTLNKLVGMRKALSGPGDSKDRAAKRKGGDADGEKDRDKRTKR